MSKPVYVVQFPHPGAEHRPHGPVMPWNSGDHARKFMIADARFGDGESEYRRGPTVLWGEWEGPSRVVRRWPGEGALPRFLHEPYFATPPTMGFRQNTDPWVFGGRFYYSNCKQRTNKGRTVTAMQRLTSGSVVLFGSCVAEDFVLDTAFVVGKRLGSFVVGRPVDFDIDETFKAATIDSLGTGGSEEGLSFTVYEGATASRPVHEMFSFVPCLPSEGNGPRFARPAIQLSGMINPRSRQTPSGSTRPRQVAEVVGAWNSIVSQVIDQGLLLATEINLSE